MTDSPDAPDPLPLSEHAARRSGAVGSASLNADDEAGSTPLTLAGVLFVFAGIAGLVGALGDFLLVQTRGTGPTIAAFQALVLFAVGGLASVLAIAAAYVVFWRAGFPYRSRLMTLVTLGLAAGSVLVPLILARTLGTVDTPWLTLAVSSILAGTITVLALSFTIAAARNRMLPRGLRIVPFVQFVLYVVASIASFAGAPNLTGLVYVGAGIAYVTLASNTRAVLEAAAVATADERRGVPRTPAP